MTEKLVQHTESHGIHHLEMCHGPNALDKRLVGQLRTELQNLATDQAPPLVLSSSHPSVFCPGWDLKVLASADRSEVGEFLGHFNRLILDLFSYPGPTAVAIGGHAVAGGCSLALACDLRLMVEGRPRLGISELNIGVPVPGPCVRMLRARLTSSALDYLVFRGDGCTADRAKSNGIVHRAVDSGELLSETELELGKLAARHRRAFIESKRFLLGDVWAEMEAGIEKDDTAFLDCWFEAGTHNRIVKITQRLGV